MNRDDVISALKRHEAELRTLGVRHATIFGSTARQQVTASSSDVDVAVTLDPNAPRGFARFDRLDTIQLRLSDLLGRPVDVVEEPVRSDRIRRAIERDGIRAF